MEVLIVAIALAALFIGIMVYDHFRRRRQRRHNRRFQPPPLSFKERVLRPFTLSREIYQALTDAVRKRGRRKAREQRMAEQMRRIHK